MRDMTAPAPARIRRTHHTGTVPDPAASRPLAAADRIELAQMRMLIADLRRTLKSGSPPHAILAAMWRLIDEQAPWAEPDHDPWRTKARGGDPVAFTELARRDTGPLTLLLEDLTGHHVTTAGLRRREAGFTRDELRLFGQPGPAYVHARACRLVAAKVTIARVTCKLIPDLIPAQARHDLGIPLWPDDPMPPATDVAVGTALAPFGLIRDRATIEPASPPLVAVITSRLLMSGEPVGVTREKVRLDVCVMAAARASARA